MLELSLEDMESLVLSSLQTDHRSSSSSLVRSLVQTLEPCTESVKLMSQCKYAMPESQSVRLWQDVEPLAAKPECPDFGMC